MDGGAAHCSRSGTTCGAIDHDTIWRRERPITPEKVWSHGCMIRSYYIPISLKYRFAKSGTKWVDKRKKVAMMKTRNNWRENKWVGKRNKKDWNDENSCSISRSVGIDFETKLKCRKVSIIVFINEKITKLEQRLNSSISHQIIL